MVSEAGAELLVNEPAARDFIADAFAHFKFIAYVDAALPLMENWDRQRGHRRWMRRALNRKKRQNIRCSPSKATFLGTVLRGRTGLALATGASWNEHPLSKFSVARLHSIGGNDMAKDEHNKAAEHHENAAKSHRAAAEHHGKGDHAKGKEHSANAQQHAQSAAQHTEQAHSKSQQQK
jgi:hypothetical protein